MQEGLTGKEQIKSYYQTWKQAKTEKDSASTVMTETKKTLAEIIDMSTKKIGVMFKFMDEEDAKEIAQQMLFEIDNLDK